LSVFCFTIMLFATLKYKSLKKVYSSEHHSKHKILKKNNFGIRALSHSLKNQLLAIQFESEILIDELKDNTDLLETANTINNISKQTIERLNEMHKRIQSQSIILEPAYINDFIDDFASNQVASMPNDISLNYKLTSLNPRAFIDEEHIGECLNVMIKNAIEAIEAGDDASGIINILTEVINDWVIISVHDNGIGMEKEIQSKIFKAFYTTKTGDNNWGIGLSYVKQIIDIHNGNTVVESSKNKGTTIKIMLPLIM
uniref:sensor histidine kinase n=1 Tax=Vallitalea guaymasensis TaxID=1185412 RepID=UPI00272B8851